MMLDRKTKRTTTAQLIDYAVQFTLKEVPIVRNKTGIPYAMLPLVPDGGKGIRYEAVRLSDPRFGSWIARTVSETTGSRLPDGARKEVVTAACDQAFDPQTPVCETFVRVGEGSQKNQILIDLCDAGRNVITVSANGVGVCPPGEEPPFLRPPGMGALPNPIGIAPRLDALRTYVNLPDDDAWILLVVYLLYSLRPNGPYALLLVSGTAGSSKSSLCRVLRRIIDPSSPEIQSMPRSEQDLVITATNSLLIVLDNLREVPDDRSDSFCRLATGAGMRARRLFTDSGEVLFDCAQPVILNGITAYATQTDLLDRSIHIELPVIANEYRRTEEDFWTAFARDRASIFAGLLDALSKTMAKLGKVAKIESPLRMADLYRFGRAVELALGWPEDSFHNAIMRNKKNMMAASTAGDPLVQAVLKFAKDILQPGEERHFSAAKLLDYLVDYADQKVLSKAALWPQSAHAVGKRLRTHAPALQAQGVTLDFHHSGDRKIIVGRTA